jgi:hypothetical protein
LWKLSSLLLLAPLLLTVPAHDGAERPASAAPLPQPAAPRPAVPAPVPRKPPGTAKPPPPEPPRISPADVLGFALDDLRRQPAHLQPYTRYLSLAHLLDAPPAERALHVRILTYHVNSLSRSRFLAPPVALTWRPSDALAYSLPATPAVPTMAAAVGAVMARQCGLPDTILLRLTVTDYQDFKGRGFSVETWEDLLRVEPYFHQKVVQDWPGGQGFPAGKYSIFAHAAWVNRDYRQTATWKELRKRTHSAVAVVRGDWFLFQTALQAKRDGHGYYDFLALGKDEKDFQELVGANVRDAKNFGELGAIVRRSEGVTINNRQLRRQDARYSGYWYSIDVDDELDQKNLVRQLLGPDKFFSEQVGALPNGLPSYWLQDEQRKRADTAPDFIAHNTSGKPFLVDGRVHVGPLVCGSCHQYGLHRFEDYVRRSLAPNGLLPQSPDQHKAQQLRALYATPIDEAIQRDIENYNRQSYLCCGLGSKPVADGYVRVFWRFSEEDVSLARGARELGYPPAVIVAAFRAQLAAEKQIDTVLAAWLAGDGMRRAHFEEAIPLIELVVAKYVPDWFGVRVNP